MARDAKRMRGAGPVVFSQARHNVEVDTIARYILSAVEAYADKLSA